MLFNFWAHFSYFIKDFYGYLIALTVASLLLLFLTYKIFESERSLKRKKVYISLVFSAFMLIVCFSAVEGYFRFVYDQSDGLGFLQVNKKWHERHVVFNSNFYRDRDFGQTKKEGVIRIGAIGDSLTLGGGIKDVNNRYTNILEKKLKEAGYNVEVFNLGKSGEDTQEEIADYQKIKYLNFDIIVWEYFLNDIQPLNASTGTTVINNEAVVSPVIKFISQKSYLLDYLYWRLSARYQKTFAELKNADLNRYKEPDTLANHEKQIADFLKQLKEDNKKVVIIIFPFVHLLPDYPASDVHEEMSRVFRENGVEAIDLLDYLKGKQAKDLVASRFDFHPNEYVHSLAADRLLEKMLPLLQAQPKNSGQ